MLTAYRHCRRGSTRRCLCALDFFSVGQTVKSSNLVFIGISSSAIQEFDCTYGMTSSTQGARTVILQATTRNASMLVSSESPKTDDASRQINVTAWEYWYQFFLNPHHLKTYTLNFSSLVSPFSKLFEFHSSSNFEYFQLMSRAAPLST